MKKTFIFLIFILLFTSCNVAEIAGIGKSDLGDNFSKKFDGLIHYYKFDSGSAGSTRFDSAGSVNLTDYTSTSGNTGVYGNSIDCSTATTPATSGILTAQGISEGISSTGSYTVSFWIYMNTIAVGGIFAYGPMEIAITATGAIQATLDGTTTFSTTSANIGTGGWNHVVLIFYESSSMEYYLNGTFNQEYLITATGGSANALYVCYTPGTGGKLDGRLDSLGIFNRAISAEEVSDLYNNTIGLD